MKNQISQLPDLFTFNDGSLVKSKKDWPKRRQQCLDILLTTEYGDLPPSPESVHCEILCLHNTGRGQVARHGSYRITAQGEKIFSFNLQIMAPPSARPCPVVLTGDGCWRYPQEAMPQVLSRGFALAIFNRTEIVADRDPKKGQTGLKTSYSAGDYGALSAWAWGYHRCVDALETIDFIDSEKIVATGHSRGGKAALLAGATDQRIAITAPNNSGCGGAGSFYFQGPDSETLQIILGSFAYWFHPDLKKYIGKQKQLPFDQHFLKAAVAPRPLLTTEALGDLWANPSGTWITHLAAKKVYELLDAKDKIATYFRPGQHRQGPDDWQTILDFADYHFFGKPMAYELNNK